jgi:ADP-ribosylglycohydrolase
MSKTQKTNTKLTNAFRGMVYGAVIGDILGTITKNRDCSSLNLKWQDYADQDIKDMDWSGNIDRMFILLDCLEEQRLMNCFIYAKKLVEWREKGNIELPSKTPIIGMQLNFTLAQKDFLANPLNSSKTSYNLTGAEIATNEAFISNIIINATVVKSHQRDAKQVTQKIMHDSILHTSITNYDSRCVAASLTQTYVINNILLGKPIRYNYIKKLCQSIIVSRKIRKTDNLLELNDHLSLAMNYKNTDLSNKETGSSHFIETLKRLNIGNLNLNSNQSYVMITFTLFLIMLEDMILLENISSMSDERKTQYFVQRVLETMTLGGDACSNCSIVGALVGLVIGYDLLPKWKNQLQYQAWIEKKL